MNSERRAFLKKACGTCAALLTLGAIVPTVQSCAPLMSIRTDVKSGDVQVAKLLFTEENKLVLIRNASSEFDIAVVQLGADSYKAFEMQCSHQANPLVATRTGFFCNAHGSSFTLDGKVKNPPATGNLREYRVSVTSDFVLVTL
jgi:nitrite reductase/ring-hydroxylating ferredoxin subunit